MKKEINNVLKNENFYFSKYWENRGVRGTKFIPSPGNSILGGLESFKNLGVPKNGEEG
jgi:hypothetical protein